MRRSKMNTGHIKMILVGIRPSEAGTVDSQRANFKLRIFRYSSI